MSSLGFIPSSSVFHGLTRSIYEFLTKQAEVIQEQEDTVQFLNEADMLIDVEGATGLVIEEEAAQLDFLRAVQTDMEYKLDLAAGANWRYLSQSTCALNEVSDSTCYYSQPCNTTPRPSRERAAIPDLNDPLVGTKARYDLAYENYRNGLFVAPSQLMKKKPEQPTFARSLAEANNNCSDYSRWWESSDNLRAGETAGEAGRPYGARDFVAPMHRPFNNRQVPREEDGEIKQFRYPMIPENLPIDPEFDPDFWSKQLQDRGDIFANKFTVFQTEGYAANETTTRNRYREYSPCEPASPIAATTAAPPPPALSSRGSFASALRGYTPATKVSGCANATRMSRWSDSSSELSSLATTPSISDFDLGRLRNMNINQKHSHESSGSARSSIRVRIPL